MIPRLVICLQLVALSCLSFASAETDNGKSSTTGALMAESLGTKLVPQDSAPATGSVELAKLMSIDSNDDDNDVERGIDQVDHNHDHGDHSDHDHDLYDSDDDESDAAEVDDDTDSHSQTVKIQQTLESLYKRVFNKENELSSSQASELILQAEKLHSKLKTCNSWCRQRRSEHSKFKRLHKILTSSQIECEPDTFEDNFDWLHEQGEYVSLSNLLDEIKETHIDYCVQQLASLQVSSAGDSVFEPIKQSLAAKKDPVDRFWLGSMDKSLTEDELRDAVIDSFVARGNEFREYESDIYELQAKLYSDFTGGIVHQCETRYKNAESVINSYNSIAASNVGDDHFVDILDPNYDQLREFIENNRICAAIYVKSSNFLQTLYKHYLNRFYSVQQIWSDIVDPNAAPVGPEELLKRVRILTIISQLDALNRDIQRKSSQLSKYIATQNNWECQLGPIKNALSDKQGRWNHNVRNMFVYFADQAFNQCLKVLSDNYKSLLDRMLTRLGKKDFDSGFHELEVLRLMLIDSSNSDDDTDQVSDITRAVARYLNHKGLVQDILKNRTPNVRARKVLDQKIGKVCPLVYTEGIDIVRSVRQLTTIQELGVDGALAASYKNFLVYFDVCANIYYNSQPNDALNIETLVDLLKVIADWTPGQDKRRHVFSTLFKLSKREPN